MGMTEIRETRHREGDSIKSKLKEAKYLLHEVCEELDQMEFDEKRGYRIAEDDRYDDRMSRRRY